MSRFKNIIHNKTHTPIQFLKYSLAGAIAAAIVGLLAIYLVMGAVKRGKLEYFSYYCFTVATVGVLYFSLTAQ